LLSIHVWPEVTDAKTLPDLRRLGGFFAPLQHGARRLSVSLSEEVEMTWLCSPDCYGQAIELVCCFTTVIAAIASFLFAARV